ncbi:phytoene desaturase family protein [Aliiroseovarius sp. 2305UL8-7]|uniref:phytoene desaturase family protein n=1 Tax=Aliiroseovarius conchicola TaxID=3121637 RepID=UPI003526DEE5
MSNRDFDVVIAGGGHNSLACGAWLARSGLKVCVVERNPWIGGGCITREVTQPGFKHDLFGSSHVWIHANPDFQELLPELEQHGLEYLWEQNHITGHPNLNGDGVVVYKDVDKTCESIAKYSVNDAKRYREIYDKWHEIRDGFIKGMFSPPAKPGVMPNALQDSYEGLLKLKEFNLSSRQFVMQNFESDTVRAFILGWAMAPQIFPDTECTGQSFYILIPGIHTYGAAIPKGGSMMLPTSLANYIKAHGGEVLTEAPIDRFVMDSDGSCVGVRLESGEEITASKGVVTGLGMKVSFLDCMDPNDLHPEFVKACQNYSYGSVSIARVHYALNELPDYNNGDDMNACAFHRIFGTMQDIDVQYGEIMMGKAPTNPFLWSAGWTKLDPGRAPEGKHTLILDTFVPSRLADGTNWDDYIEEYTEKVLMKVMRRYTSNMDDSNILGAYYETGVSLEAANPAFVSGNTTGGERLLSQMGYMRPLPGFSQYKSPIKNLYMTGPSCHPGGGITAMGTITANVMLRDWGMPHRPLS